MLQDALSSSPVPDRVAFFEDCLRLRRRERHLWGDTPLAEVFTEEGEKHLLRIRAVLQQVKQALKVAIRRRKLDPITLFSRLDADHDGALTYTEMQRLFDNMSLGFSAGDVSDIVRFADGDSDGRVSFEDFLSVFDLSLDMMPSHDDASKQPRAERWSCPNCTFFNFASDKSCSICGYGRDGRLVVPKDKWLCDPSLGGCSLFNDYKSYFCETVRHHPYTAASCISPQSFEL